MSRPRIPYVEPEDAEESVRDVYEAVESNFGEVLNIVKVLGNSSRFLNAVMGLLGALNDSSLDGRYRELAYLMAAHTNECEY